MSLSENSIYIHEKHYNLSEIDHLTWQYLLGSASFRTAVVATVAKDSDVNPVVSQRTVVIREVNSARKILYFHTDCRSDKVRELEANPLASLLFYDAVAKIQVRLQVTASLYSKGELADLHWQNTPLAGRKNYCAVVKPGSTSPIPNAGLPFFPEDRAISQEESEVGRPNFMVISCQANWMDWLYLNPAGHRRAQFWYNDSPVANWVIP